MQIFSELTQALGLQRCSLAIEDLPARAGSRGALSFRVALRGGARRLQVRELRVCLEEERLIYLDPAAGEYEFWDTAVRATLPLQALVLQPYATVRMPVCLPLPELEPSEPLRRYRLLVIADAPGINPRASAFVEITQAAEAAYGDRAGASAASWQ